MQIVLFFCIILLTIFIVITQVGNDKPESSASDEESSHLTGDKDRTDHEDDGPTYATVKKPKKSLHLSTKWVRRFCGYHFGIINYDCRM